MTCPICDNKPPNCDCTERERRQHEEIERLTAEVERLRAELAGSPRPAGWLWLTEEDEMP